jgi:hypothetical protein
MGFSLRYLRRMVTSRHKPGTASRWQSVRSVVPGFSLFKENPNLYSATQGGRKKYLHIMFEHVQLIKIKILERKCSVKDIAKDVQAASPGRDITEG